MAKLLQPVRGRGDEPSELTPNPDQRLKQVPDGFLYITEGGGAVVIAQAIQSGRGAIVNVLKHPTHDFTDASVHPQKPDIVAASIVPRRTNWDDSGSRNTRAALEVFGQPNYGIMIFALSGYYDRSQSGGFNVAYSRGHVPLTFLETPRPVRALTWDGNDLVAGINYHSDALECTHGALRRIPVDTENMNREAPFSSCRPEAEGIESSYSQNMWGMESIEGVKGGPIFAMRGEETATGRTISALKLPWWEYPVPGIVDWDCVTNEGDTPRDLIELNSNNSLYFASSRYGCDNAYGIRSDGGVRVALDPKTGCAQVIIPKAKRIAKIDPRSVDGLGSIIVPDSAVRSLKGLGREEIVHDMRFAPDGSLWVLTSSGLRELEGFPR